MPRPCSLIGCYPKRDRPLGRAPSRGPAVGLMFHASPACLRSLASITSISIARSEFNCETRHRKFPSPCCASLASRDRDVRSPINPNLSLRFVSGFQPRLFSLQSFVYWLVLGIVLFAVLYPAGVIILSSFETPGEKLASGFGLQGWKIAFSDPAIVSAIWNTLTLTLARQAIALPIAILLAWVIARTDVPYATTLEFLFWLGYFLPPLPVTMGWILLLDPDYGLFNQWLTHLPWVSKAPVNIYSFWGIVWAHLTTSTIAVEVMLLTPAFRNMDATLEEASLVSGAGVIRTLRKIVVPLMTPIVGVVLLLGIVHSLQ